MTYTFEVIVKPKLGQKIFETAQDIAGVLSDLKDYEVSVQYLDDMTDGHRE